MSRLHTRIAVRWISLAILVASATLGTTTPKASILSHIVLGTRHFWQSAPLAVLGTLLLGTGFGLLTARYHWLGEGASRYLQLAGTLPIVATAVLLLRTIQLDGLWITAPLIGLVRMPEAAQAVKVVSVWYAQTDHHRASIGLGATRWFRLRNHLLARIVPGLTAAALNAVGLLIWLDGALELVVPTNSPSWGAQIARSWLNQMPMKGLPAFGALVVTLVASHVCMMWLAEKCTSHSALPLASARKYEQKRSSHKE